MTPEERLALGNKPPRNLTPDELIAMGIPEFEDDYEKWMARPVQPWVTQAKAPKLTQPRLFPDSVALLRPAHAGCSVQGCGAEVVGAVAYRAQSRAVCSHHGDELQKTGWRWVTR